jgi:hypothetical protein
VLDDHSLFFSIWGFEAVHSFKRFFGKKMSLPVGIKIKKSPVEYSNKGNKYRANSAVSIDGLSVFHAAMQFQGWRLRQGHYPQKRSY